MAAIYTHKKHGLQINYTVYFPDGSRKSKYRYTSSKTLADLLLRYAKTVETGSRAGNLTTREIAQARHDDLLSEEEARLLSGGKVVELYCLDRILKNFETSSKLKNSPYNHKCTMWRAKNIAKWLRKNPIPNLTIADVKLYAQQRMSGDLLNINGFNGHSVKGVSAKTVNNET